MSDKERLQKAKEVIENYNGEYHLHNPTFTNEDLNTLEWLIEQAERVQELEDNLINNQRTFAKIDLGRKEENKRYLEALKFYANEESYEEFERKTCGWASDVEIDRGEKARQAIEGE